MARRGGARLRWSTVAVGSALICCELVAARGALAQRDREVQQVFRRGTRALQQENYERAAEIFEKAYRRHRVPLALYNAGVAYNKWGRYTEAIRAFSAYVQYASDDQKKRARAVRTKLRKMRRRLGTIRVRVKPEKATIRLDDRVVRPLQGRVFVEPGRHRLTFAAEGLATQDRDIRIGAGKERRVAIRLEPPTPAQRAERTVDEAIALAQKGEAQAARRKLNQALETHRSPRGLAWLAHFEEKAGEYIAALEHLNEALGQRRDEWVREHRRDLAKSRARVARNVGRLRPVGGPRGATLRVDGEKVGTLPLKESLRLETGTVTVEVEAEGYEPWTKQVRVRSGSEPVRFRVRMNKPEPEPASSEAQSQREQETKARAAQARSERGSEQFGESSEEATEDEPTGGQAGEGGRGSGGQSSQQPSDPQPTEGDKAGEADMGAPVGASGQGRSAPAPDSEPGRTQAPTSPPSGSERGESAARAEQRAGSAPQRAGEAAPPPDDASSGSTARPDSEPGARTGGQPGALAASSAHVGGSATGEAVSTSGRASSGPSPSEPGAGVPATGFEMAIHTSYTSMLDRTPGVFLDFPGASGSANKGAFAGELFVGARPWPYISFGVQALFTYAPGNDAHFAQEGAEAQIYTVSPGLYVRGHTASRIAPPTVDVWADVGFQPHFLHYVRTENSAASRSRYYKVQGYGVPVHLGLSLYLTRGFALSLVTGLNTWIPRKYCVDRDNEDDVSEFSVCTENVSNELSGSVGLAFSFLL